MRSTPAKLGLLGCLYFSQGLPFGFFSQALPVVLRQRHFSLSEIGLSSLLAAPWALKFLWAPRVDRPLTAGLAATGRRRSWILPLQLAAALILVGLALAGPALAAPPLMAAVLALNFVAATQDIATDGLAVELLAPAERGVANGLQVAGYRAGMIVGGGALLVLYDHRGPRPTFLLMAALTALASGPVLAMREPPPPPPPSSGPPLRHFLRLPGAGRILLILITYKAGDSFATGMLRPFLSDLGLSLADVGWLIGTVGFVAGLLGAVVGGVLVNAVGRRASLVAFGLLQAFTVGSYAWLAASAPSRDALLLVCGGEHFAGGMATAALFTCMMDWSRVQASGTDYTVQASAVVIASGLASLLAGFSAERLGYLRHFELASALALVAIALVAYAFPGAGAPGAADEPAQAP